MCLLNQRGWFGFPIFLRSLYQCSHNVYASPWVDTVACWVKNCQEGCPIVYTHNEGIKVMFKIRILDTSKMLTKPEAGWLFRRARTIYYARFYIGRYIVATINSVSQTNLGAGMTPHLSFCPVSCHSHRIYHTQIQPQSKVSHRRFLTCDTRKPPPNPSTPFQVSHLPNCTQIQPLYTPPMRVSHRHLTLPLPSIL